MIDSIFIFQISIIPNPRNWQFGIDLVGYEDEQGSDIDMSGVIINLGFLGIQLLCGDGAF